MPIEFLNSSATTTKKFRSDTSVPLQPGGSGGQFAAATSTVSSGGAAQTDKDTDFDDSLTLPAYKKPKNTAPTMGGTAPAQATQVPTPKTAPKGGKNTDLGTGAVSLRVFPNPSRRKARDAFGASFSGAMWTSTNVDYRYLYSAACQALSESINNQIAKPNLHTTPEALDDLAKSPACAALHPFMYTNDTDFFDIYCVAYLLNVFGEQRGEKLQLGVVQEDPKAEQPYLLRPTEGGPSKRRFAAFLVGSKYNKDPDKTVVWIRLQMRDNYQRRLQNDYSGNLNYNSYDSVSRVARPPATPAAQS